MGKLILFVWFPVSLLHRFALRLDTLLFPQLNHVPVDRPLFIVGLPRSGTTLLHRLIAADDQVFTTMPLWELVLAPAVCEKKVFRLVRRVDRSIGSPVWKCVQRIERRLMGAMDDVHSSSLHSPEEDYLGLLPFGGCFLRVLVDPFDPDIWKLADESDRLDPRRRARLLRLYRGIVQRHLYFRGQHLHFLSKNPSFTCWILWLADEFPQHDLPIPELYVPPAWALGRVPRCELSFSPFSMVETLTSVWWLDQGGRRRGLPLLGFEADTRVREHCLRAVNQFATTMRRRSCPVRVAIHPEDHRLRLRDDLKRTLGIGWEAVSYRTLFESSSPNSADQVA